MCVELLWPLLADIRFDVLLLWLLTDGVASAAELITGAEVRVCSDVQDR